MTFQPPAPLLPPQRILMGPGPSDVPASVLQAMARPIVGHLDPFFLRVMDESRDMLREVLGTTNTLTFPMSGTGSAGMETCIVNLVEPGDRVLVAVHGVFGGRMAEVARRAGAEVVTSESSWGRAVDVDALRAAAGGEAFDLVCVVHAETSTGVLQPLAPLRALADDLGALLVVDAVTSLAGVAINLDEQGVDAVYSGTQKCLSCPPGLAPVSFSPRAVERLERRKTPVQSWYLDLSLIARYWGGERAYHHTAPIQMIYALHESLRLVLTEGLAARQARHERVGAALCAGLQALGLKPLVPPEERLPMLTTVAVPDGVDEAAVRRKLLTTLNLEIGGGLGPMKGRAWRIGTMGSSATIANVLLCLEGLRAALSLGASDAAAAALAAYAE